MKNIYGKLIDTILDEFELSSDNEKELIRMRNCHDYDIQKIMDMFNPPDLDHDAIDSIEDYNAWLQALNRFTQIINLFRKLIEEQNS